MDETSKVNVLVEALSWVHQFSHKIIVIKYGGHAMVNEELQKSVMQDIMLMKSVGMIPIVIHGGGPFISSTLEQLSIESTFENGLRVSDEKTMAVVEMVLNGSVNSSIVRKFNQIGEGAIGLSGLDDNLIKVNRLNERLGYVGVIESVNSDLLYKMLDTGYLPVISSIGIGKDGHSYNINADAVASAVAIALKASKIIYLTDTMGVLENQDDPESLISELTEEQAYQLMQDGVISGGMIPKVEFCLDAVNNGVSRAHIIDGRISHSLLLELFLDMGIGTMIVAKEEKNDE